MLLGRCVLLGLRAAPGAAATPVRFVPLAFVRVLPGTDAQGAKFFRVFFKLRACVCVFCAPARCALTAELHGRRPALCGYRS